MALESQVVKMALVNQVMVTMVQEMNQEAMTQHHVKLSFSAVLGLTTTQTA